MDKEDMSSLLKLIFARIIEEYSRFNILNYDVNNSNNNNTETMYEH